MHESARAFPQSELGSPSLCVLIPAYNESLRLPQCLRRLEEAIKQDYFHPLKVQQVVVVDDGSSDNTVSTVKNAGPTLPSFSIVSLGKHRGKGAAVRCGWSHAHTDWVLISDADVSVTWRDSTRLAISCLEQGAPIAIGLRGTPHGQGFIRKVCGRLFNFLVRKITGLEFNDTQCGFKLFKKRETESVLQGLQVEGFAWDVEVLVTAKRTGLQVVEVPVTWRHDRDSRVRVLRDGPRMLKDVLRIRFKHLIGQTPLKK